MRSALNLKLKKQVILHNEVKDSWADNGSYFSSHQSLITGHLGYQGQWKSKASAPTQSLACLLKIE